MAFAFGKDSDQNICASHLLFARGLYMDYGALDDTLEGGGWGGINTFGVCDQTVQFGFQKVGKFVAQNVQRNRTGTHDTAGVGFIQQSQQ